MTGVIQHLVTEQVQASDDSTFREELPVSGALHALIIKVQCTNGATAGRDVTILDVIDEIRVRSEKQDPIFFLSSQEIEKWMETEFGKEAVTVYDEQAAAVQEYTFVVWFGRKVYDAEYFLPLSRHKRVELEIVYSPNIAADGGFATGTVTIDVQALITPQETDLTYLGTLAIRRIYADTTVASGEVNYDVPDEAVLRKIGVYVYEAGIADNVDVTRIIAKDKALGNPLLDMGWDDFLAYNQVMFGGTLERLITMFGQNNDTVHTRLGEILYQRVHNRLIADLTDDSFQRAVMDDISGDLLRLDYADVDVTAGAEVITAGAVDAILDLIVKGKFPSYFGFIPFIYPDNEGGWLDVKAVGGHRVTLTNGAAGGTVRLAIQEVMRF